jgi:hypothetical protein
MVAEQNLGAGGDIFEADLPLAPDEMLGHPAYVTGRLIREAGESRTFRLRLDDTAQGTAHE